MSSSLAVALVSTAWAVLSATGLIRATGRLHEPAPDELREGEVKLMYSRLAQRWWFIAGAVGLSVVLCGWLSATVEPQPAAWAVTVAVPCLVVLSLIDARTQFLPTALMWPTYVLAIAGVVGWAWADKDASVIGGAVIGWAVYGGFQLVLWLLPLGYGTGDLRLSGALGLTLGALGWSELLVGILGGIFIAGVVIAPIGMVIGGRKAFVPHGPSMIVGMIVAIAWADEIARWSGYTA